MTKLEPNEQSVSPAELARRAQEKAAQNAAGDLIVRPRLERDLAAVLAGLRSLTPSSEIDQAIAKLVEAVELLA
jgi:hypothetical protein